MNWAIIWELVKINLLYSNPQALGAIRQKQSKRPTKKISAYKSMLRQQVFLALFLGLIYSVLFIGIDFSKTPGLFTVYLLTFMGISILNAFPAVFTVFYDSKDSQLYLPLPIKPGELLIAKTLSTLGMILGYLVPALGLLILCYLQLSNPVIAVLLGLFNFLLITLAVLGISVVLVNRLGSILIKSPHKKLISSTLLVLSQIIAFIGIMFINTNNSREVRESGGNLTALPELPLFSGFYHIADAPFSMASIINYGAWFLLLAILIAIIAKVVIPSYYRQLWQIDNGPKTIRQRKTKVNRTTNNLLFRHHLSTLKVPALWSTVFLTAFLYLFFLAGMLTSGQLNFASITPDFFGILLIFGILVGMTSTALTMVGISLERDNYTFIRTLPINFKRFLVTKFWILFAIQAGIPALVYSLVGSLIGLHPILVISLATGILLGSFVPGQFDYRKDLKHLMLNWQNVNQLMTRGNRNFLTALLGIVLIIGFIALVVFSVILAHQFGALTVSTVLTILTIIIALSFQIYIYRNFWKNL
ncbi:ABC transporter permease [Streptococcus hillyeri]|uniref:ABC transporter permease n=1 Tax=Streptococcus hillyeri TaxID=2282420 RepID=A0A3L9DYE2_9STRE|nr:ABC transporter permease [Streptococcus hillyeri]RLY04759.1 ABC transporter permease [Streptococcus hillyeri]